MDELRRKYPITYFIVRFGCGFAFGVFVALLIMLSIAPHSGFDHADPVSILLISGTGFGLAIWLGGERFLERLSDAASSILQWWR